jgi:agmatine deiminase
MAILKDKTPRELGFRMPAEWDRHEATWLGWPQNAADWPGKFAAIPWVYAEIVRLLSYRERVNVLVGSEAVRGRALSILERAGANLDHVAFQVWATDRVWLRDSGPIFVKDASGTVAITDWKFNAWAKYDDWKLDDQVPVHAAKTLKMDRWQPMAGKHRLVLEGGSIDVNGAGTMITTEECLLSEVQQRNPGITREGLEQVFSEYLGIDQVIWLGNGIAGDDTHGHVDDITRFVDESTIVTAVEPNLTDYNHSLLADNLWKLKRSRTLDGKQWGIVELPLPRPVVFRGQRLPASYTNFYIANGLVLVPTFNDPNDRVALGILAELFPGSEVIGIHAVDLVWGLGTLHCMTQQQPA